MPLGPFPLANKTIVVTGGGSGINLSFVQLALQSPSTKILLCDLSLTPPAQALLTSHPSRVAFYPCDVSSWAALNAIPSRAASAFGEGTVADIWIAGAGVFEPKWSSWLYDTEDDAGHYKQFSINAEHPLKLTRIAFRSLLSAGKKGVVLIVSSLAGTGGQYAAPLYCASKHAVVGFTKSMMQADVDEGLKVVCILPGMVSTPLWTGEQGKDVRVQYGYSEDVCVSSEEVARAMMELIEDPEGKYPGGSLLEVSKKRLRGELESRQGIVVNESEAMRAWADNCYEPIRQVWGREKEGGATQGGQ